LYPRRWSHDSNLAATECASSLEESEAPSFRTPKLSPKESSLDWFRYYAGYSSCFVEDVIAYLRLPPGSVILDPWNGSGTTTEIASRLGFNSLGVDINPAAVVLAIARHAQSDEGISTARQIRVRLDSYRYRQTERASIGDDVDPLLAWMTADTVSVIRQALKHTSPRLFERLSADADFSCDRLPRDEAIAIAIFFRSLRSILRDLRLSNPTWMKRKLRPEARISVSSENIIASLHASAAGYANHLSSRPQPSRATTPRIYCADSRLLSVSIGRRSDNLPPVLHAN
jgi:DNA methylase